ncbi:MAG: TolC family protein [Blastocatellia bacterium]|nr:TolC family protein [Blastocatellia bacterium]
MMRKDGAAQDLFRILLSLSAICLFSTGIWGQTAPPRAAEAKIPEGVSLVDGLSEDEAVAIALWNNPALQADLSALGLAKADLVAAGLLHNPILQALLPTGYSQFEMLLNLPAEVFWQRKRRVAAAQVEYDRIAKSLEQNGLNLARDVRVAYANLQLAHRRVELAEEGMGLRQQIHRITQARLRLGDISEIDANAVQLELTGATEQATRFSREVVLARDRLMILMGSTEPSIAAGVAGKKIAASDGVALPPVEELVAEALAHRPDLQGAALAIEAAARRAKWERSRLLTLSGLLNIKQGEGLGFSPRPGVLIELPVFHRNKGGITRADAEVERASRQYLAVRQQIVLDVREAFTQVQIARQSLDLLRARMLPEIEAGVQLAQERYRRGEEAYLFTLENTRRLIDARLIDAETEAALHRAEAQLHRSLGKKHEPQP